MNFSVTPPTVVQAWEQSKLAANITDLYYALRLAIAAVQAVVAECCRGSSGADRMLRPALENDLASAHINVGRLQARLGEWHPTDGIGVGDKGEMTGLLKLVGGSLDQINEDLSAALRCPVDLSANGFVGAHGQFCALTNEQQITQMDANAAFRKTVPAILRAYIRLNDVLARLTACEIRVRHLSEQTFGAIPVIVAAGRVTPDGEPNASAAVQERSSAQLQEAYPWSC